MDDYINLLKNRLPTIPDKPGVYIMLDSNKKPLYIGKAKSLINRVRSYTNNENLSYRTKTLLKNTSLLEITTTDNEAEALLLEANLVKQHQPKYNILLRDDKSFPYIIVRGDKPFRQIVKYRGKKIPDGCTAYGPFTSANDVKEVIGVLNKIFLLRSCSDKEMTHSTKPCLQYQIKHCSAPCVGKISSHNYEQALGQAEKFLQGKAEEVTKYLLTNMQQASQALHYELAARYRDNLQALEKITVKQKVGNVALKECDCIAMFREHNLCCFTVACFKSGNKVGNLSFFVNCDENDLDEDVLEKFIVQFYQKRQLPEIVMVNIPLDLGVLSDALSSIAGKKIKVQCPKIGINRQIINNVLENAKYAMVTKIADQENRLTIWKELKKILGMKNLPECIEVYDNSHIFGSHAVGAVIVIGKNGFLKSAYRCYHIKNISYGNDYAYLREVLTRRLGKLITSDAPKPELIIIDGGKGQLSTAYEVLSDIGLDIKILAIAKGKERKVGAEHYYTTDKLGNIEEVFFPKGSSNILHFLQAIRDEAHRFAIANYRKLHAKHLFKISPKD